MVNGVSEFKKRRKEKKPLESKFVPPPPSPSLIVSSKNLFASFKAKFI
jgi:hypothetical protein